MKFRAVAPHGHHCFQNRFETSRGKDTHSVQHAHPSCTQSGEVSASQQISRIMPPGGLFELSCSDIQTPDLAVTLACARQTTNVQPRSRWNMAARNFRQSCLELSSTECNILPPDRGLRFGSVVIWRPDRWAPFSRRKLPFMRPCWLYKAKTYLACQCSDLLSLDKQSPLVLSRLVDCREFLTLCMRSKLRDSSKTWGSSSGNLERAQGALPRTRATSILKVPNECFLLETNGHCALGNTDCCSALSQPVPVVSLASGRRCFVVI